MRFAFGAGFAARRLADTLHQSFSQDKDKEVAVSAHFAASAK
jgi:hypothetical protein